MVFVPLYAAIRLTMERNDSNIDLLFITTICAGDDHPRQILGGRGADRADLQHLACPS